jgi:hypothetical protein
MRSNFQPFEQRKHILEDFAFAVAGVDPREMAVARRLYAAAHDDLATKADTAMNHTNRRISM